VVDRDGTIRVEKRAPTGAVRVDRATGTIVEVRGGAARGARDLIMRLHAGDFAGWTSRIAYALVGLAVPVLSITGYLIWALRRSHGS
jgi:uncharacterized iron-regulated membrane protein